MSNLFCPICGGSFEPDLSNSLPFCSDRCRQVDLGRWFEEQYGLPIERESGSATDEESE